MGRHRFFDRFRKDHSGVAAVEMALVAPVIAFLAFVSFNLWDATQRLQNMDEALRVTSQYFLNGGAVDADARQLGLAAWTAKPSDGNITIVRDCRCGQTAAICTTLCTGSVPPSVFVRITASGTTPGAMFQANQSRVEVVRVR